MLNQQHPPIIWQAFKNVYHLDVLNIAWAKVGLQLRVCQSLFFCIFSHTNKPIFPHPFIFSKKYNSFRYWKGQQLFNSYTIQTASTKLGLHMHVFGLN